MCIIVDPSLYLLIEHICYIPQVFIRLKLYLPSTNGLSYGFLGLFTHCRQKLVKNLPYLFFACLGLNVYPKKSKDVCSCSLRSSSLQYTILVFPYLIPVQNVQTVPVAYAVDICLFQGYAVRNPIIRISCPRNT